MDENVPKISGAQSAGLAETRAFAGVMEFEGPLISHWREHYDLAQLRRAQGKGD